MAINYSPIGWDSTKYVNPTNMNHMDEGIKKACDGVDAANESLEKVNSDLENLQYSSVTLLSNQSITSWNGENYLTIDISDEVMARIGSYRTIVFSFGTGSQNVGGTGQLYARGMFIASSWNSGCPLIQGCHARWQTDITNKKMYIWCDQNPTIALRAISLEKNF